VADLTIELSVVCAFSNGYVIADELRLGMSHGTNIPLKLLRSDFSAIQQRIAGKVSREW
jgi:hypothetical protein